MFGRDNPYTGQRHAVLIRSPPVINQQEQCILGGGGNTKNGRASHAPSGRMDFTHHANG